MTRIARLKVADNNVSAPNNPGGFAAEGLRVSAGNANSANDQVYLNIFGNTSAGQNGVSVIGVRKQGINPAVNVFVIFDNGTLPGSSLASPPTNAQVQSFINANNPNGNGTDIISGSGFVKTRPKHHLSTTPCAESGNYIAYCPDAMITRRSDYGKILPRRAMQPSAFNVLN
jgi:hypothetical protein